MNNAKTPQEVLKYAADNKVEFVDIRFTDMFGQTQHFTMPLHAIDMEAFEYGLGIDGSSIRGWKAINASDMFARLDPTTAFIDPFFEHKTLVITADIYDPISLEPYNRDPRYILKKAIDYVKGLGIADTIWLGPEAEFFIFSDVRYDSDSNQSFYTVDSPDAAWNTGTEGIDGGVNLGHKMRVKGGYFPVPPNDIFQDMRTEMLVHLERAGIETEKQHHEVASAGQGEVNIRLDHALAMADKMVTFKYILKNVAKKYGYTLTFMPKPIFGDNGSGMHTHQSLWKDGKNLFAGSGYAGLSDMAMNYVGGLLANGPSVLAFTNPTTNSYKRLVPGYEAPVNLVYSARNRSAAIRIPMAVRGDKAKRIEFRTPDASSCPYLAFAAMIMAGVDGIVKKTNPGEPADFNLYEATDEEKEYVRSKAVPQNLSRVLDALESNAGFLTAGGVFDKDFIDHYVELKRAEVMQIANLRPHPYEFVLYYDC
jgi:glutamine synthetase